MTDTTTKLCIYCGRQHDAASPYWSPPRSCIDHRDDADQACPACRAYRRAFKAWLAERRVPPLDGEP